MFSPGLPKRLPPMSNRIPLEVDSPGPTGWYTSSGSLIGPFEEEAHCHKKGMTLDIEGIVEQLRAERSRIDAAIAALGGTSQNRRGRRRGTRRMSAAARARISAAQKARWAKQKRNSKGS